MISETTKYCSYCRGDSQFIRFSENEYWICKTCNHPWAIKHRKDFSHPTWQQLSDKQDEIDRLYVDNHSLKDILYATRILDMSDGSPCWCCLPSATDYIKPHDEDCIKARCATESIWRKHEVPHQSSH